MEINGQASFHIVIPFGFTLETEGMPKLNEINFQVKRHLNKIFRGNAFWELAKTHGVELGNCNTQLIVEIQHIE